MYFLKLDSFKQWVEKYNIQIIYYEHRQHNKWPRPD